MKIVLTDDGSHTLYSEQFDEIYHSRRGALTESVHVFIQAGLAAIDKKQIRIWEAGFGTGLNALLSSIYAAENQKQISYTGIELYPVADALLTEINYDTLLPGHAATYDAIHRAAWNEIVVLSPYFNLQKLNQSLLDFDRTAASQDIIYFDAFSPEKQPELWTAEIFKTMYDILAIDGILVTYCSKGYVRRNMQAAGFSVEKLAGPPGKHEMVRARKVLSHLPSASSLS